MEHPKREPRQMPNLLDGLVFCQTRKYGKSSLSIFESVQKRQLDDSGLNRIGNYTPSGIAIFNRYF